MFEMPNLNFSLKEEEIKKLVIEAEAEMKKGRTIEELFNSYKEKYSLQESFMIMMQVKLRTMIDPEFHNFKGNIRHR